MNGYKRTHHSRAQITWLQNDVPEHNQDRTRLSLEKVKCESVVLETYQEHRKFSEQRPESVGHTSQFVHRWDISWD